MSKKTKDRFLSTQEEKDFLEEEKKRKKEEKKAKKAEEKAKKDKKKQKTRELMAFTPKQMKSKYEGYGLDWHIRDFFIAYSLAIAVSTIFSYVFSFQIPYIIATFVIAIFFAPIILTSQKKYQYEANRFSDINIYMQQFASGMIKHERVIAALEECLITFPSGEMKDIIEDAIEILYSSDDVREGELAAFALIEEHYGNRQLSTLHDFALKIEDRGGDFVYEISLLDKLRIKWKERINEYQKDLSATTLFCIFEYAMIIVVCGFIQDNMPETMNITHVVATQVAEVIAILVLFMFLLSLQKKKCQNWIEMEEPMPEEEAETALDYVENFDPAQKRNLSIKLGVAWGVGAIALIIGTKSIPVAVFCILFEIVLLNSHFIILELTRMQVRTEIRKSFPKWLFDICLLMQKENVANSITKSIPDAPPIMKRELNRLNEALMENPASPELLINFLKEHNVPGVRETMSMLVSLDNGSTENNRLQMEKLVDENMNMLDKEDELAAKLKAASLSRYYYYPMLPCAGLMGVYFINVIFKILIQIQSVLGV